MTTRSGRLTSPFPNVDTTTERRTLNTLRRVRTWLLAEARAELDHRRRPRIEHLTTGIETADVSNWSPADGDMCEAILFDPDFWGD